MKIPYNDLTRIHAPLRSELIEAFDQCVTANDYIGGEQVRLLEKNLKEKFELKHLQTCGNGTDALFGALKALKLERHHEIIVPAMTWISSAEIVDLVGAQTVFCDVSPETMLMEAEEIEAKITRNTKAIILVHLYGNMPNMDAILELAKNYKLEIIEDCAQAHLSRYNGVTAGNFGKFGTFSFFPGKNLGAFGDAGAVTCNNYDDHAFLKQFFNHGQLIKNEHQILGMNSRLDALQARILNIKLTGLHTWTEERQKIASEYNQAFNRLKKVILPKVNSEVSHSYHIYSILVDDRKKFTKYLEANGIGYNVNYPNALHKTPAYRSTNNQKLPIAEKIAAQQVSLPIFPGMTPEERQRVIQVVSAY